MSWFLGGIALLILGYFTYGKFVDRLIPTDESIETPCVKNPDGVDYVALPKWKNMMIQLLNIAGVGPVIGVIIGIKFGKVALVIIPLGCVFMGAVHDMMSGVISMRMNGANLPKMLSSTLGRHFSSVFSWVMVALLLLCVTVFINIPANLIDREWLSSWPLLWPIIGAIFLYYIAATLFPVDKIIGRFYPFFGALLVIGSAAIFFALVWAGLTAPEILNDCPGFAEYQEGRPLFPLLFITIACGIISGFHATQSPIVARTMTSEREARATFYGMMIAEGVIAMIWAAAALAIYNLDASSLSAAPTTVLASITNRFLGRWVGGVTILAVVILSVTSGDTALRSSRLAIAELLGLDQTILFRRVLSCLPLIAVVSALLWWSNADAKSFNRLWNYFALGNQMISATVLMAASVWLLRTGHGFRSLVTLVPGGFMLTVVFACLCWCTNERTGTWGLGLSYPVAICCATAVSTALVCAAVWRGLRENKTN